MSSKLKQEAPNPLEIERQREEQKKKQEERQINSKRENERRKQNEEAGKKALELAASKRGQPNIGYYITFGIVGVIIAYILAMMYMDSKPNLSRVSVIDESNIDEHNSYTSWKQGASSFFEGLTLQDAKNTIGVHFSNNNNMQNCPKNQDDISIPESFDARDEWRACFQAVESQGHNCVSLGIVVSNAIAERECIKSKGKVLKKYSAQDLLSCDTKNKGCSSGHLNNTLDFVKFKGIVEEECFPYKGETTNTTCNDKCNDGKPTKLKNYCLVYNEENIKKEILKNGPLISVTQVNIDFLTYSSGIYRVTPDTPKFAGFQAINIVGWGVSKDEVSPSGELQKYWIVQNSWGSDWGEQGYVRIAMYQDFFYEKFAFVVEIEGYDEDNVPTDEEKDSLPFEEQEIKLDDSTESSSGLKSSEDLNVDEEQKPIE